MRTPTLFAAGLVAILLPAWLAAQTLSIQGNGHVDRLTLRSDEAFSLSLSIDAEGLSDPADWFVIRQSASGFDYFDLSAGGWLSGASATLQAGLFSASAADVYTAQDGLAAGSYIFYFGIDRVVNGQVDLDSLVYDALNLTVTAAPATGGSDSNAQLVAAVEADCAGSFNTSETEAPLSFEVVGSKAIFRGLIDGSTPSTVENLLANNPGLRTIVLAYGPGSDDDESNLQAARLIRNAGIATCVPDGGQIFSGAVDFFLAGSIRRLGANSTVGVHSWADGSGTNGNDLPREHPDHQLFLDYYAEMGISQDFYWFTLQAAPPSGMHNMSAAERVAYMMETP